MLSCLKFFKMADGIMVGILGVDGGIWSYYLRNSPSSCLILRSPSALVLTLPNIFRISLASV